MLLLQHEFILYEGAVILLLSDLANGDTNVLYRRGSISVRFHLGSILLLAYLLLRQLLGADLGR